MTNREWLESLSDSQLAAWLCDCLVNPIEDRVYGVSQIKFAHNHSELGLIGWFNQKRNDEVFHRPVKFAKWMSGHRGEYYCSLCGYEEFFATNYCGKCGARMTVEQDVPEL